MIYYKVYWSVTRFIGCDYPSFFIPPCGSPSPNNWIDLFFFPFWYLSIEFLVRHSNSPLTIGFPSLLPARKNRYTPYGNQLEFYRPICTAGERQDRSSLNKKKKKIHQEKIEWKENVDSTITSYGVSYWIIIHKSRGQLFLTKVSTLPFLITSTADSDSCAKRKRWDFIVRKQ